MYNVAIKATLCGVVCAVMAACSGKSADSEAASQLLAEADTMIVTGDFAGALATLDTLKSLYPREVDVQRAALRMRPIAMEGLTINQIEETDRNQAYLTHIADSLMTYFTKVHNPDLGDDYDYYVVKECKGRNFFERTGVEGRVSPSGEFYIISSLTGRPVKHTSISVVSGSSEATTSTVAYDDELNYRSGGTETITFTGAQTDTIGQFLCNNPSGKITLRFNGKKSVSVPLSKDDRMSLIRGFELGRAMSEGRKADSQRRLLEQQLALARDQIARTTNVD